MESFFQKWKWVYVKYGCMLCSGMQFLWYALIPKQYKKDLDMSSKHF